jgi:hypothetical protein
MHYLGQWGVGAVDTPGPLNGIERSDLTASSHQCQCHLDSSGVNISSLSLAISLLSMASIVPDDF